MTVRNKHGIDLLVVIEDEKAQGVDVTTFTPEQTREWLRQQGVFACSGCHSLQSDTQRSVLKNVAYPDMHLCLACNGGQPLVPGRIEGGY